MEALKYDRYAVVLLVRAYFFMLLMPSLSIARSNTPSLKYPPKIGQESTASMM